MNYSGVGAKHEQNGAVASRHLEKQIEAEQGPNVRQSVANCSNDGSDESGYALLDVAAAHGLNNAVACFGIEGRRAQGNCELETGQRHAAGALFNDDRTHAPSRPDCTVAVSRRFYELLDDPVMLFCPLKHQRVESFCVKVLRHKFGQIMLPCIVAMRPSSSDVHVLGHDHAILQLGFGWRPLIILVSPVRFYRDLLCLATFFARMRFDIWMEAGRPRVQILTSKQRLLVHEVHNGVGIQMLAAKPVQSVVFVACPPNPRSLIHVDIVTQMNGVTRQQHNANLRTTVFGMKIPTLPTASRGACLLPFADLLPLQKTHKHKRTSVLVEKSW